VFASILYTSVPITFKKKFDTPKKFCDHTFHNVGILMKDLLTKTELLNITGINSPRTLEGWISKKWLPPVRKGGGRAQGGKGVQNEFDLHAATWAIVLNDILRAWPKVGTPVHLYQFRHQRPKNPPNWTPTGEQWKMCLLSDGLIITNYLRQVLDEPNAPPHVALTLLTGYKGVALRTPPPKEERFALIRIESAADTINALTNWFDPATMGPYTTDPNDPEKIVQVAGVMNISQLYHRVYRMAEKL